MPKPIDKKRRAQLREALLPHTLRIVGRALGARELFGPTSEILPPPRREEMRAQADALLDTAIDVALDLADRAAVKALQYDGVIERRERDRRAEERAAKRVEGVLKKAIRKANREDDSNPVTGALT